MKLFWKIFFTTMFVSVICVMLSGYIMFNSSFQLQLDSEVKTAQEYGEIVFSSLNNEFKDINFSSSDASYLENKDNIQKLVSQVVQSISIDSMNQKIAFAIIDTDQNTIFSSLNIELDKSMISSLKKTNAGWVLKEIENKFYVQTIRPAEFLDCLFYIETIRDVTHIFNTQKTQAQMMMKIILGMTLFAGIVTFIISKLLLRRIVVLTEITKRISDGNLNERAAIYGNDEITLLSQNFNQMAECLEEKIYELEEEAERKELFVGAFSHELKTPLTSIIGYSDFLRRKDLDTEQKNICADYIFSEGKRLETLSMRLLELIVLKKQSVQLKPVMITDILDEVRMVVNSQLHDSNIELVYELEEAIVSMEVELMKTVFINVIDNARNAIERDGIIKIYGYKKKNEYVLSIKDSGKGMEKQELEKVTKAFYMVDKSRSRKHGGAGLGLAICNEILMLHGFDMKFDSTVNVGTTVIITMRGQKNEQI